MMGRAKGGIAGLWQCDDSIRAQILSPTTISDIDNVKTLQDFDLEISSIEDTNSFFSKAAKLRICLVSNVITDLRSQIMEIISSGVKYFVLS